MIALLVPQMALGADLPGPRHRVHHHYGYRAPHYEQRAERSIIVGPIVECSRHHFFLVTHYRCDTGISETDPNDMMGF